MHLPQRGLSIVFNGEIYNFVELRRELQSSGHTFRSDSDTEVLLAAYAEWGTDFLSHLNGMFAFALFDAREQRVLLGRDRVGEKPLYYRIHDNTLFFASELKAFLAHPFMPRRIDPEALDCYLLFGYVPGDRCILEGYHKLPPAHALSFDLRQGAATTWRFWDIPEFNPEESADEADLVDELDGLLRKAVKRQLRADVPVGIFLSGGIDSSLVTAMAASHLQRVHTFSVGFPGHDHLDETIHARQIARYFETEHTEFVAEPASAELIPLLARQFDEPMADSSMVPTYQLSRLVREQCTVALGGDGGDELFAGYPRYSRLLKLQKYGRYVPAFIKKSVAESAARLLPVGLRGRNWAQALDVDLSRGMALPATYFDARTRRQLMIGQGSWSTPADAVLQTATPCESDLLQRATRLDFGQYLADDILVKVDRASMLNSLEVRAPFLDYQLIEFAFGRVPSRLKATTSQKKILLKHLTHNLLPPDFDRQRKQGFSIPSANWLKEGPFRDLYWDVLTGSDCTFDRKTVGTLLRGQDRGLVNGDRLFALVLFELWRVAYGTYL